MIPSRYQDFYGDETRWFVGTVVSVKDPIELGRIKVRIMGVHGSEILDEHLPFAQTVLPVTEGGTNGLGIHTGIQVNARVFGVFLDGKNSQLPLVLGSMPKYEEESPGGRSTNQLTRGTNTLVERKKTAGTQPTKIADGKPFDEPDSPYNTIYPMNQVHETQRGHVIEIDDSHDSDGEGNITGYERIHIYHKSGTFLEMHPNGDVVTHHKNGFRTVTGNDKLYVTGDMEITVDGNLNLTVKGNVTETVTGNVTESVTGSVTETYGDGQTTSVTGDQTTTTTGKILLN